MLDRIENEIERSTEVYILKSTEPQLKSKVNPQTELLLLLIRQPIQEQNKKLFHPSTSSHTT